MAKSQKRDQQTISRDELVKGKEKPKLTAIASNLEDLFERTTIIVFGKRWFNRLERSSARARRSPLGYALDVLLK